MLNPDLARDAATYSSQPSAVSWAAIIAGAVVASATGLLLFTGAASFGLAVVSPWRGEGVSATTIGISAIIVTVLINIVAFGVGGYMAGRLRRAWTGLHGDETSFRDSAHGFTVWALSAVLSAYLLTAMAGAAAQGVGSMAATGAGAAAAAGAGAAVPFVSGDSMGMGGNAMGGGREQARQKGSQEDYLVDTLLRRPAGSTATATAPATPGMAQPTADRGEIKRVIAHAVAAGDLSPDDKAYLANAIASDAGISPADAQARIDATIAQVKKDAAEAQQKAKEAADAARKATSATLFLGFITLLIGAFSSSYLAIVGGRARDDFR